MLLEFCSHQFCVILPQEWVSHPESGFLIRGGGKPLPPPSPSIDPLTFCLGVAQETLVRPWHLGVRLLASVLIRKFLLFINLIATQDRQRQPSALWPSVSSDPGCRTGAGVCFPGSVSGTHIYPACPRQHF